MQIKNIIHNLIVPRKNINKIYQQGISIITPVYDEEHLPGLLESIKNQTLENSLFEIIIITPDKRETTNIIKKFKAKNPFMDVKIEYKNDESTSYSKNWGIECATKRYVTFINEQDCFSKDYLKIMFKYAQQNRIVVAPSEEVDKNWMPIHKETVKSKELNPNEKLREISTVITGKLMPSVLLKQIRFNTRLSMEEDMVFLCRLLNLYDFDLHLLNYEENIVYQRVVKHPSEPDELVDYKSNVSKRIKVIKELNKILTDIKRLKKVSPLSKDLKRFIKKKIKEQTSCINRYLLQHPKDLEHIRESIRKYRLNYFPYSELNKGLAKNLVISYCFPPYKDTSGNNMAKRVRENKKVVDVIQNDMTGMRKLDHHLHAIADEFIENQTVIDVEPSFGNWDLIHEFCKLGMEELSIMVQKKGVYTNMYSRAMFPASNFLAFEFKIKYPQTRWIAEFSDPVLYDIKSRVREVEIKDKNYMKMINNALEEIKAPQYHGKNLFFLCEYLTYLFADEIVFTNINQKQYMMNKFPIKEIKEIIEEKSIVKKHPTLPEEFYQCQESSYPLDDRYVNFAYFGSFYETRSLNHIYYEFENLDPEYQDKYRLHLFTSDVKKVKKIVSHLPIKGKVIVNNYLSYLEFLNLTTKFQCLIITDAETKMYNDINPYLPSKLSDYMGSGTDIWDICEEGSILSTCNVKYKSYLGDESSSDVVKQIINHHIKTSNKEI